MTNSIEWLIGFDYRQSSDVTWSTSRESRYLLRDVERILSIDDAVWQRPTLTLPFELGLDTTGINNPLWSNLTDLLTILISYNHSPLEVIGITRFIDQASLKEWLEEDITGTYPHPLVCSPCSTHSAWTCLGYDVADEGMISGISNCEYSAEEKASLNHFGTLINCHHLFDDLEIADQFRVLTNLRVPEHSPFSVYCLYHIQSLKGKPSLSAN